MSAESQARQARAARGWIKRSGPTIFKTSTAKQIQRPLASPPWDPIPQKMTAHGAGKLNAGFINGRTSSRRTRSSTFEPCLASHGPPHEPKMLIRKWTGFATLMFAFSVADSQAVAGCNSCADSVGNTSISYSEDARGSLHSDSFGNTPGQIGGERYNSYTDYYGNTSGSYGSWRLKSNTGSFGNSSGSIGGQGSNSYTDNSVNTTGSLGGQHYDCYSDSLGNTSCR